MNDALIELQRQIDRLSRRVADLETQESKIAVFPHGDLGQVGRTVSVTVNNNSATTCGVIDFTAGGWFTGGFLVTFTGAGAATLFSDIYLVKVGWSDIDCERLGASLTGFGMTSVTVTAAVNTTDFTITFTLTQVNTSAEAHTVTVNVIGLSLIGARFALTAS